MDNRYPQGPPYAWPTHFSINTINNSQQLPTQMQPPQNLYNTANIDWTSGVPVPVPQQPQPANSHSSAVTSGGQPQTAPQNSQAMSNYQTQFRYQLDMTTHQTS